MSARIARLTQWLRARAMANATEMAVAAKPRLEHRAVATALATAMIIRLMAKAAMGMASASRPPELLARPTCVQLFRHNARRPA